MLPKKKEAVEKKKPIVETKKAEKVAPEPELNEPNCACGNPVESGAAQCWGCSHRS